MTQLIEYYLGIDVGYSQDRASTGLCLLELNQGRLRWACRNTGLDDVQRRTDLRGLIPMGARISAVSLDGPLGHKLERVAYYRAADSLLARGLFQRRCKPGPTNSPTGQALNIHANKWANIVLELMRNEHLYLQMATHPHCIHGRRIVEAFPNSFLGVLLHGEDFANLPPRRNDLTTSGLWLLNTACSRTWSNTSLPRPFTTALWVKSRTTSTGQPSYAPSRPCA